MNTRFCFVLAVLVCAALLCGCFGTAAQASILGSYLTFDGPQHTPPGTPFPGGGEDALVDDSLSVLVDPDGNGIDLGDTVWGLISLSEVKASGLQSVSVVSNQVMILFAVQISGAGTGGSLANVPDAVKLASLLPSNITAASAGITNASLGVVLSLVNASLGH